MNPYQSPLGTEYNPKCDPVFWFFIVVLITIFLWFIVLYAYFYGLTVPFRKDQPLSDKIYSIVLCYIPLMLVIVTPVIDPGIILKLMVKQ